ncbi:hypothetical protein [Chryseobacterium oryctis]|uniref:Uncharacterized protein n=1 Tax=Chryseobacterium oryctis TaxID=2952618 RepID=A0ABT3HLA9_9FLAO|nr:hypothetical protein [Chryseobacterium oryctis]MCW3160523.1 hypothetical protein [Chryseobacterium oryctis]
MATNNTPPKTAFTVGSSLVGEGIINYKETNNMTPTNNASQTLFRFVSLRNPQLTETKKKNLGFIHKDAELPSAFDAQVNPNDTALVKFQALERATKNFDNTGYQNELQIEEGFLSELLEIGRKISKKEVISSADEDTAKSLYNSSSIQAKIGEVWDNLIYQTVTQSNFYVKEALVHILKALHFGYVCDLPVTEELTKINGDDLKAKAMEARVVLPMKFFGDGYEGESPTNNTSGNPFQVNVSKIGEGVINGTQLPASIQQQLKVEGEKISELSSLTLKKEAFDLLISELEKIQKSYYKLKTKAYDLAYKAYSEEYQPLIDEYNRKLEEIESRITEETTEDEIREMYAELGEINVPQFSFSYRDELNFEDFKNKLSLDSLKLFVEIFTDANDKELDFSTTTVVSDRELNIGGVKVAIEEEYDTYSEVFEKLLEETSSNTQLLLQKTSLNEKVYANLGGVLIPVNETTSYTLNTISRSYYLQANQNTELSKITPFITFYYQAESNAWGTASAKISAITDFDSYEETYSNINVNDNKVSFPSILFNKFEKAIRVLKIQIFFNNGEEANLEISGMEMNQPYTGILYTERIKGETGNPDEGTENPKPGTFIPKHFGVKRLGIADYLKVEQSVHAYVPGEVSNIENVMASELRHKSSVARDYSEITDTTSESIETEKISDTTKAERNEMQTEVLKELEKQQSITANTNFSYNTGVYKFDIGAGYANNTAQHDSNRQAVAKSQEITERAMERVLTKINKERVQKIIKEYTETNVHEFDNRGKAGDTNAPQHITGVYRWVDKKMKNQIYNYGKRTMFEFMIPEPAKLHRLSAFVNKETFVEPVDPRKAPRPNTMTDPKSATKELLEYWANIYGVSLETLLPNSKQLVHSATSVPQTGDDFGVDYSHFVIPDNYAAKNARISCSSTRHKGGGWDGKRYSSVFCSNLKGDMIGRSEYRDISFDDPVSGLNITGNVEFKVKGHNVRQYNVKATINCELSDEYINKWKTESFNAIIKAYEAAYADFLAKQKEAEEKAKEEEAKNKENLSVFHRDIESVILKHNCIAYLLQDYLNTLGQNFTSGDQMKNFQVILGERLEEYTALAKFMEQAFEWEIMDYTFYPYYWAHRDEWQKMYLTQDSDPLFRSFLQAGMARVIVTVKPGFEDAVQFFMCTGRIWNGGEVPVIGDPMYMSIVDEMKQPTGEPQGKYWITRIPTTLTILQAKSVGLEVEQPLPIFPEDDPANCENPKELEFESSFSLDDIRLEGTGDDKTTLG